MKNFVKPGKTITLTAPSGGVVTGLGYLIGGIFVVATASVAETLPFEGAVEGVIDLVKLSAQAWAEGDRIYWDNGNHRCTTVSSDGPLIGIANEVAANPSSTGRVRLDASSHQLGSLGGSVIPSATVAAAGNSQGTAAAIATGFTLVSAADGTKGVVLPAAAAGKVSIVKNGDAANAVLKVYPASSDAINAIAADAAISMAAKTSAVFVAYDATTWYTVPLLPS